MTSKVIVHSANYPVLIETYDSGTKSDERVITTGQLFETYVSLGREVRITDIAYEDPRVPAPPPAHTPR